MKIIKSSGRYSVYTDGIEVFDELPAGTYKLGFDPQSGFFLTREETLKVSVPKIYGKNNKVSNKVVERFLKSSKGMGVALTGFKGSGKTLNAFQISELMHEQGYPTILVDIAVAGMFDFLTSIKTPSLVLFDEFEKTFVSKQSRYDDDDDGEVAANLLTYLDGSGSGRKLNLIISNSNKIGEFLMNRPGRILYKYEYLGLQADEITEYLTDKLDASVKNEEKSQALNSLILYAENKCDISYDILSAISSELNYGESFKETMSIINFEPELRITYKFFYKGREVSEDYNYIKLSDEEIYYDFRFFADKERNKLLDMEGSFNPFDLLSSNRLQLTEDMYVELVK